jgi:hypothetical protein
VELKASANVRFLLAYMLSTNMYAPECRKGKGMRRGNMPSER